MVYPDRIIVLTGLMWAGKSRIGMELAKLLAFPFVDADREIERAAGITIPEIFDTYGEEEFRKGEKRVMFRLLSEGPKVLASGGGAFINPEIRAEIGRRAVSVWLKADFETLFARVSRTSHRPLLRGDNPAGKLKALMEVRYPVYAEADIMVETDRQTPHDMAQKVKAALEAFEAGR